MIWPHYPEPVGRLELRLLQSTELERHIESLGGAPKDKPVGPRIYEHNPRGVPMRVLGFILEHPGSRMGVVIRAFPMFSRRKIGKVIHALKEEGAIRAQGKVGCSEYSAESE